MRNFKNYEIRIASRELTDVITDESIMSLQKE